MVDGPTAVYAGAVVIGLVHGAEPGHGWPIAATYALARPHRWLSGLIASTLLGLGHLVSSLAVVAVYFLALTYFDLTHLPGIRYIAGILLILLGIREYRHGHSHDHGDDHSHDHGDDHSHDHGDDHSHDHSHGPGDGHELSIHNPGHAPGHAHGADHEHGGLTVHGDGHSHDHDDGHSHDHGHSHGPGDGHDHGDSGDGNGWWSRIRGRLTLPTGHSHDHGFGDVDDRGLAGIVTTAFVLGFAHEEEFEIIGLCTGAGEACLELMMVYAIAVLVALVALTLLLVAGYERYEERVERYAEHFPTVSAVVLITMGLGFIAGVL